MGKALPQSKQDAIQARLEEGRPHFEIAEEMKVSIQTVKNYSATLRDYGTIIFFQCQQKGLQTSFDARNGEGKDIQGLITINLFSSMLIVSIGFESFY